MDRIGAYEAKTHLPKLLQRVAKGESITITKHGMPIAVLRPFEDRTNVDIGSVIKELREFRMGKRLEGGSIRGMIEEGRR